MSSTAENLDTRLEKVGVWTAQPTIYKNLTQHHDQWHMSIMIVIMINFNWSTINHAWLASPGKGQCDRPKVKLIMGPGSPYLATLPLRTLVLLIRNLLSSWTWPIRRLLQLQTIKAIVNSYSFKGPKSDEPRRVQVLDLYCLIRFESEGSSKGIVYVERA